MDIFVNLAVALDVSNLVFKKHGMNGEPMAARTNENRIFPLMHRDGGNGHAIFILKRLQ